ncbi:Gfo/Idh/MocA family protein [Hymenobacter properus]|uniref:Gfo/Idh/MocA family oxidoreductase n=1 Tax=Hymenobacter properus TaxID=2791026 RepID=A0A931BHP3_9BACT|nr:Gfo/Idh/MocA family oxidoreductase [Hymenobacter properus]MBF9142553.1 Gfo/Idh/MocA family oxidoreductase [Hymenobacter properus]MBR7721360.1 Gfo/Idh/MocA family oxidoreductase [Microvirga sp. SRT04]
MKRRTFTQLTGSALAGSLLTNNALASVLAPAKKTRVAMVGTGHRGLGMWGVDVLKEHGDKMEFVGLCDINPGRVETGKKMLGVSCPTFTDFDKMMKQVKPDVLIVTTVDATHNHLIVKGMEYGADIVTEKPMTTDEKKCQEIIDAEKRTGKKVKVTFNYRYSPHRQKLFEMLRAGVIGNITSADFHWYLDVHHGADYFRRWHRLRQNSGSLLVHKATHHFDLLNWWLDSDPEEVYANGQLNFYGKNNSFRHTNCRPCPHKDKCQFYWDVTKDARLTKIYVDNEKYDGYLRDGCVWKEDIDIFDKMAVQIKYANQVQVSYSLTTYSPYEGYRIAFNGTKGRLEAWIKERQTWDEEPFDEIQFTPNFGKREIIRIPNNEEGHGGGDVRLRKQIFAPGADPYRQSAGTRDGAMSCLVGIAARHSIDTGKPVKIGDLTSLKPQIIRA